MQIVNDGRHSVPTSLLLVVDGDTDHPIPLSIPDLPDQTTPNATVDARVQLPQPVTGTSFAFYVDGVREVKTRDWYSGDPITMPIGIAELGIPGVQSPPEPAMFDSGCRTDLVTVDGKPLGLRVSGETHDALQRRKLDVEPCQTAEAAAVTLTAGEHVVRTGIGRDLGIDIDRLLFSSAAGGARRIDHRGRRRHTGRSPGVGVERATGVLRRRRADRRLAVLGVGRAVVERRLARHRRRARSRCASGDRRLWQRLVGAPR